MRTSLRWITGLILVATGCAQVPTVVSTAVTKPVAQSRHSATVAAIPQETIVRLSPGVNPAAYAKQHGMTVASSIGLGMYLLKGEGDLATLKRDRQTLWAESNHALNLPKLDTTAAPSHVPPHRGDGPNDPLLPAQYGIPITGTDKAWAKQKGSPDVIVAVIDSGIDGTHPEFAGQLLPGWDLTGKVPGPGGNFDGYGHGTHVAGIIGAKADNGIGGAGVAPGCKLLPVRIFDEFGHSAEHISTAAIIWAVDHGARVINASWGSPMESEADKTALQYAFDHDVVFVSAVGNDGGNDPNYPGASDGVIGVAATTDIDTWGSFSTYGDWVSVAAPGEGILSTFPMAKGNGYRIMRGTSMACPFVTGAAALIRSQFPQMTRAQVKARLESTAKDVIQPGKDPYSGNGRINVERAILDPLR